MGARAQLLTATGDLLFPPPDVVPIAEGAVLLGGFANPVADALVEAVGGSRRRRRSAT